MDWALQVEDLARLSFKNKPLYVGVDDTRAVSTREGLEQGYVVAPADKRLLLLFTFLKKNLNKKVMVFFSSCNSVKYHRCAGNCRSLCGGSGLEVWIGERGGGG
jgi:superfamily II DNA/RNA helicase